MRIPASAHWGTLPTLSVRTIMKRSIPQSVFDSAEARKVQRDGHRQALNDLLKVPRDKLDRGNPNHPDYDLKLFGQDVSEFMAKQYK